MRKPQPPHGFVWCRAEDNWRGRDACLKVQENEPYRACKRCPYKKEIIKEV